MKGLLLFILVSLAEANIFMQNPRGSNNRWSSANDNVQNQNRLFRSRNDARGGYNYGQPMYYYVGSQLQVEWTQQHGCDSSAVVGGYGAEEKVNCDVVLQYMCGDLVRDGLDEGTITQANAATMQDVTDADGNTVSKYTYGMHEDWYFYNNCTTRNRNRGLWISDRTINGQDARYTRQNPTGQRYGFECSEERDYYPYWHPTPWRDIAIYTNHEERCDYYQSESQNVNPKSWCKSAQFNNELECPVGEWMTGMAWGIEKPACLPAQYSRSNHLGDTIGGYPNRYSWTIPYVNPEIADACILRIRYNVTQAEVAWDLDYNSNEDELVNGNTYFLAEGVKSPVVRDPYILFGSTNMNLSYAMDTTAYGITFQDRSHVFMIRERPAGITNNIYNLNVRGKRGNIVETFPAVEYDFVPDVLSVKQHEWIHPQWTGTDQNTANAAGEGLDQTDRTNFVQTEQLSDHYPASWPPANLMFTVQQEAVRFAFAGQTYQSSLCKSLNTLLTSNNNDDDVEEDVYNCMKMNLGTPYFDGGLVPMRYTGTFYYMSTRNNNFTNRSQKGTIVVTSCTGVGCPQKEDFEAVTQTDASPRRSVF